MINRQKYFLAKVKFLLILGLLTVLACSDGADQGDSGNIDSKSIKKQSQITTTIIFKKQQFLIDV